MTIDLHAASAQFAQEVLDLVDGVLPIGSKAKTDEPRIRMLQQSSRYVIRTGPEHEVGALSVYSDGECVGALEVNYYCELDTAKDFLAVRKSKFQLTSAKDRTPLLRLDFLQGADKVPAAHWNVHAERGATSVMLARCNPNHPGLVSQVHLPVGGVRARPCLEDFLEMLISEFNIDRNSGWQELIQNGRQRWRVVQTRSMVRDSPEDAADVLRRLGYAVSSPDKGIPSQNLAMLRCR